MKKKQNLWVSFVVIIVAIGTILTFVLPSSFITPAVPVPLPQDVPPRNDTTNPDPISDLIVVNSPSQGASVTSPLTVTGKARGSWYFEASFPIELIDAVTGLNIGTGHAEAQGEWMTSDFVPFIATLTFNKPSTTTQGILILRNDNPSGLPENDKSISIPVVVK